MAKYASGKYIIKNPEKYIGKRAPTYRSSWEFTFMSFADNNPSVLTGQVKQLQFRIEIQ